ncbi:unnamed protein product [Penicillium salamii]|uniref:Uncharacterized protein n=1 Tax=Penicillium salamii TaxID=1612424 RepID=A0A9W4NK62_9EURO|nr:unnamed protein product [Penicillium salamii]
MQVKMPMMESTILFLVHRLYTDDIDDPLIKHVAYQSVIDAVGGEKDFVQMIVNAIDPRVLALQGKMITVERLDSIRLSQSQESNPWPHSGGGYCDFITDSRDTGYWRGYVGQASILSHRISQHCRAIRGGKNDALHYHIITKPSAAGHRYGNFIRLWTVDFPICTPTSTKEVFENILEMAFTRAFQTLSPSILEKYFGPCPEGSYSNLGLNVIPPLMQGRELAPTVRGKYADLLGYSSDPEISEWPSIRAKQKLRSKASEKSLVEAQRQPRLNHQENIHALYDAIKIVDGLSNIRPWPSKDKVYWAPLETTLPPFEINVWFAEKSTFLLNESCTDLDIAIPIGTVAAFIGIVLDSIPTHTYGTISLPWGLRESGFTDANSLIWFANFQKYKLIPDTFRVSTARDEEVKFLSKMTQELLMRSNLRVILLCGDIAEQAALREQDLENNFILDLQGCRYEAWLRIQGNEMERIFVRSPAPLLKLWSNKGPASVRIGTLFRFVSAITNTRLSTTFFESALTVALIIRGWDDERFKRIEPLQPELEKINPALRIWLERLGFREDDHVRRLTEYASGSLRLGLLVLMNMLPRKARGEPRKIPQSKEKRRGVVSEQTKMNVRSLLEELQQGNDMKLSDNLSSTEDTTLPEEDMITEAIEHGSVNTTDFDPENGSVMIEKSLKRTHKTSEVSQMAYGRTLKLLIGYNLKGHESRKGEVSTYQFNVQHVTFRIHKAPPNHTTFFVKAEVAPVDEKHSDFYATKARDSDPGIRFGFRVSLRDEKGQEFFVGHAHSSTWQAIAIANSFVDGLEGDTLEEICQRRRRFIFIDKRVQRVPSELRPFVNGAYRDDENKVVRFNSAFATAPKGVV